MSQTLTLDVAPDWSEIDRVRERSVEFLRANAVEQDAADAVAMAACELTENACKYGVYDGTSGRIEFTLTVAESTITVEVRNPVAQVETAEMLRLDGMIQWIRGFQDPFQAYLERVEEVCAQSLHSKESGLGLVRIAYEGQSILDFHLDEESVSVCAVFMR